MRQVILMILFFTSFNGYSQSISTSYQNHAKYWYYRTRLRNDFLLVGPNQGMSIPMQQRGYKYYPSTTVNLSSNANYTFNNNSLDPDGEMPHWGDAMGDLGYYIGVLATEYELLHMNSQNTDSTIKELYYALYAFNRLDINAEPLYNNCVVQHLPTPIEPPINVGDLNGFASRDDVDRDFVWDNAGHFNYYGKSGFCSKIKINDMYDDGDHVYNSSWAETGHTASSSYHFISQDNYYNVLVGLMLVRRLVPDHTFYTMNGIHSQFQDGQTDISSEALKIAERVINYFQSNNWNLKYPDGSGVPINEGGNTLGYSFGHYEAFCKLRDKKWGYFNPRELNNESFHDECDKWNWTHVNTGHPFIDGLTNAWRRTAGISGRFIGYTASRFAGLHSTCPTNPQSEALWEFSVTNFNNTNDKAVMILNLISIGASKYDFISNTSGQLIENRAFSDDGDGIRKLYHGALLAALIHGYENCSRGEYNDYPQNELTRTGIMLTDAPCDGTYAYGAGYGPSIPYEWHTTNRLDWPDRRGEVIPLFPGEYNGLDYMLYHNLYYLVRKMQTNDVQNKVVDFSNRNITLTYPLSAPNTGNPAWGSINNPATIGAYENIISISSINSNASVTMIAGKQIDLKPGFTVNSGASYTATIDRLDCSSIFNQNNQYMNINGRTISTPDSLFTYYESLPTSYSEYQNALENEIVKSEEDIRYEPIKKNSETLKEFEFSGAIKIFPNPTNDKIQFEIPTSVDVKEIIITNQLGQQVVSFTNDKIKSRMEISLANSPSGFYLARFVNNNGMSVVKKIIKQ